jgi:hypothetical protein
MAVNLLDVVAMDEPQLSVDPGKQPLAAGTN